MLDRLIRVGYRLLRPNARNALHTWLVLEARDKQPEPIQSFDEARVLVIAPHSDDEVIGCGGVIARHIRGGSAVHITYMTDGRWGDAALCSPGLVLAEREKRQAELVDTRKREAREAAAVLGAHELRFLDRPDNELCADDASCAALAGVLGSLRPELVYLPFVYDLHEDHWQTNLVFAGAIARMEENQLPSMRVRGYEVWTPLPANCVADITEVMPLKLEALGKFVSQLQDHDYTRIVKGLNTFRSIGPLAGRGFAEAFNEQSLSGYLRLVRAATLKYRHRRDHMPWTRSTSKQ